MCEQGEQFGVAVNWTACTNWSGYTCATGGWGVFDSEGIAYLVRSCPVSCSDGPCNNERDDYLPRAGSYTYDDDYDISGNYREPSASATECTCPIEWRGDGECDKLCNTALCGWDESDCFHDDAGCYELPTGGDYRGNVSVTRGGRTCQSWESQWPNAHTYTVANYPDANLGGHNHCRNPSPEDGSTGPWCIVDVYSYMQDEVWGYCDIGAPSPRGTCPVAHTPPVHNHTFLALNVWGSARVLEHRYDYYAVPLPPALKGFKVVVVPDEVGGDPNLFLSFSTPFPTGHNYTYKQDDRGGVEAFYMTQGTYGYCGRTADAADAAGAAGTAGAAGAAGESTVAATAAASPVAGSAAGGCTLYLSVTAYESSSYHLVVFDTANPEGTACAAGCDWKQLGDGECQPQCDTSSCFFDRGDCAASAAGDATSSASAGGCKAGCKADEWRNDGWCDPACFNAKCGWDGDDCGLAKLGLRAGCADDCLPSLIDNGECNAECNVESCRWDGLDCFHAHHECYMRADGVDYRGTISHTASGKVCQRWSEQTPNAHTRTHEKYPLAGVGGHNFCRNPDGAPEPWCYTTEENGPRSEKCNVGPPQESCPPPPPPPPPRHAPRPPHPPPPHPRPPPPNPSPPPLPPCSDACVTLFESGDCPEPTCNRTACLIDEVRARARLVASPASAQDALRARCALSAAADAQPALLAASLWRISLRRDAAILHRLATVYLRRTANPRRLYLKLALPDPHRSF